MPLRDDSSVGEDPLVQSREAGGDSGLGVLINLARGSMFDIPLMFATLLTIAAIGVALYLVVVLLERRLVGVRA